MTGKDALLPCPFCGNKAEFGVVPFMHRFAGEDTRNINHNHGAEYVECTNTACSASSMLIVPAMADAKPLLVEKWNRRVRITAALADELGGWISVRERLPEKNTGCLVFLGWVDVGTYEPLHKRIASESWYSEPAGINPMFNVTHWRELPPLPKGE